MSLQVLATSTRPPRDASLWYRNCLDSRFCADYVTKLQNPCLLFEIAFQIIPLTRIMAPTSPTPRNEPTEDELDSILNGIIDGENVFDTSNIQPDSAPSEQRKAQAMDSGLGI